LGITFGVPAITFQGVPDLLPAKRLHLPIPPSDDEDGDEKSRDPLGNGDFAYSPITHIYHNADPIAMGVCNGVFSTCATVGYAMESKCHSGKSIVLDAVSKGWSVDIRTHRIVVVIEQVLIDEWGVERNKSVVGRLGKIEEAGGSGKDQKEKRWWPWPSKPKNTTTTTTTTTTASTTKTIATTTKTTTTTTTTTRTTTSVAVTTTSELPTLPTPVLLPPLPRPNEDCYDCFKWTFISDEDVQQDSLLRQWDVEKAEVMKEVRQRLKNIKKREKERIKRL